LKRGKRSPTVIGFKRKPKPPTERLLRELRGSIVESLLDAARERRKDGTLQEIAQATFLAHCAVHHSLELADQYLILEET
jgi:hypothetical protein